MAWIAASPVDVPYATSIVPQMVLLGLGMGLISTPATESILRVLPPARAGVGSAVNDATRELGATLGVAVVGSVFASVYGAALSGGAFDRLPEAAQDQARESVVAAAAIAQGQPELMAAARDAFMAGMHAGSALVAVLCLVGAAVAAIALPGRHFTRDNARSDEPLAAAVPEPA